jgi:hypothetical protein
MRRSIKLLKLAEVPDPAVPNNIPEGFILEGIWDGDQPMIGEPFLTSTFITSVVTEVISEKLFRTCNSIYQIIEEKDIPKPKPYLKKWIPLP